ncbi:MAG: hypothetical protein VX498_03755 [Myxococcota bacterium]|nr:hypothetical protein [Myxococcota bacterium]
MKQVVSVSLGSQASDYSFEADFWGERFLIRRLGTNGDTKLARRLVREHDGQVNCIALGGMAIAFLVGDRTWRHKETWRIASAARTTPVVGGRVLGRIVRPWSIREIARREPELFAERNVLFLSGIANWELVGALQEFTDSMSFADPILHYGVPSVLRSTEALMRYARVAMPMLTRRPYVSFFPRGGGAEGIQQRELTTFFQQADVVVGDLSVLLHYAPTDLSHKIIVTDTIGPEALRLLRERGAEVVCTTTPQVFTDRPGELQLLHALCIAHLETDPASIEDSDYIELLEQLEAKPRTIHVLGEIKRRHKFAFLYYPPDRKRLFSPPGARWIQTLPEEGQQVAERVAERLPIRAKGQIRGIVSPTGEEAQGWILELPCTAQELSSRGTAYAVRRLQEATELASRLGAEVLGVATFSQAMTEACTRVAARSALPITSGSSYTISADMWAAKQAILSLGLIEQDDQGRAVATALVVGAGGASGAVAAELLGLVFHRVVILDKDRDRLEGLADRIRAQSPHCQVDISSELDEHLPSADLIVTGLSPSWMGRVNLETSVKSGAVVLDGARPAEFSAEQTALRPDVLVIREGEIELPGPVEVGIDLGPGAKTAFAALDEVIILALEGRYECFSSGGDIELERVKEIYKLGLVHGMHLAGMRGPGGLLSQTELKLVRERVMARRRASQAPPPLETTHTKQQAKD